MAQGTTKQRTSVVDPVDLSGRTGVPLPVAFSDNDSASSLTNDLLTSIVLELRKIRFMLSDLNNKGEEEMDEATDDDVTDPDSDEATGEE